MACHGMGPGGLPDVVGECADCDEDWGWLHRRPSYCLNKYEAGDDAVFGRRVWCFFGLRLLAVCPRHARGGWRETGAARRCGRKRWRTNGDGRSYREQSVALVGVASTPLLDGIVKGVEKGLTLQTGTICPARTAAMPRVRIRIGFFGSSK